MAIGLIVFGGFMIAGFLGGVIWAMIHSIGGQGAIVVWSVAAVMLIATLALSVGVAMQMGEL